MKTKIMLSAFTLLTCLASCGPGGSENPSPQLEADTASPKEAIATTAPAPNNSILGFYVGRFVAEKYGEGKKPMYVNRVNISLDSVKGNNLYGHSVVAGNIRPFKGEITTQGSDFRAIVREPGDDKYDGSFDFVIYPEAKKVSGRWKANDAKLAVTERSFNLSKTTFAYDPTLNIDVELTDVYDSREEETVEMITQAAGKINASTTLLTTSDVENMYKRDLEVMRNAIYARHGYSFKNRKMRDFFDTYVDWYIPVSTNVTAELTDLEKKNIKLIKDFEDYAESYYDSFGR